MSLPFSDHRVSLIPGISVLNLSISNVKFRSLPVWTIQFLMSFRRFFALCYHLMSAGDYVRYIWCSHHDDYTRDASSIYNTVVFRCLLYSYAIDISCWHSIHPPFFTFSLPQEKVCPYLNFSPSLRLLTAWGDSLFRYCRYQKSCTCRWGWLLSWTCDFYLPPYTPLRNQVS